MLMKEPLTPATPRNSPPQTPKIVSAALPIALVAGGTCLPLTYHLNRFGSIELAVALIALIGMVAGSAIYRIVKAPRIASVLLGFTGGALLVEVVVFGNYYFTDGYGDALLGVGVALSLMEFLAIVVVGGSSAVGALIVQRRVSAGRSRYK
jgi:hypothetical protein